MGIVGCRGRLHEREFFGLDGCVRSLALYNWRGGIDWAGSCMGIYGGGLACFTYNRYTSSMIDIVRWNPTTSHLRVEKPVERDALY